MKKKDILKLISDILSCSGNCIGNYDDKNTHCNLICETYWSCKSIKERIDILEKGK